MKNDILVLGKEPTQGFEHTLTAEKLYNINFTVGGKKFCLSLHYNGDNSYLFVNGVEQFNFKAKDSSIVANQLCLGNISKDWGVRNMKKNRIIWVRVWVSIVLIMMLLTFFILYLYTIT